MERKTSQLLTQQTTSASKALWPAGSQKYVATSRTVQRRRRMIMQDLRLRWLRLSRRGQKPLVIHVHALWPDEAQTARLRWWHIALALVMGSIIPLLCSLYIWSALPMLGILSTTLTLAIINQVLTSKQDEAATTRPLGSTSFTVQSEPPVNSPEKLDQVGRTAPTPAKAGTPTRPLLAFPETPMPILATPLVRVLETIDLSSSNIEHFLDTPDISDGSPGSSAQEKSDLSMQE